MDLPQSQFSHAIDTEIGQRILSFLQEPISIQVMKTAAYLKVPAADALTPLLLERFGQDFDQLQALGDQADQIGFDYLKKTIGYLIRRVMEQHGYVLDQTNVKISPTRQHLFKTAARYKPA